MITKKICSRKINGEFRYVNNKVLYSEAITWLKKNKIEVINNPHSWANLHFPITNIMFKNDEDLLIFTLKFGDSIQ